MTTSEERLSRLEGGYEHLATKADLRTLEARMVKQVGDLEARMVKQIADSETRMAKQIADSETRMAKQITESETRTVKWMVGLMIGSVVAATAIASTVALLVG